MKILKNILPILLLILVLQPAETHAVSHSAVIKNNINTVYQAFERNDYQASLKPLFTILTQDTIIPDETTFFLGVALSNLQRYEAGQNALLKYIKLTGDSGDYFNETVNQLIVTNTILGVLDSTDRMICDALGPLEGEWEVCHKCHGEKLTDENCKQCKGSRHEVCPDCLGKGVVVRFSYYDDHSLCKTCEGKGYVPCTRCEASGKEISNCSVCLGEGKVKKPRECNFVSAKEEADHKHESGDTEGN